MKSFPARMLMAISVAVPKNLSGIKTKVAMNLTKRQLIWPFFSEGEDDALVQAFIVFNDQYLGHAFSMIPNPSGYGPVCTAIVAPI